MNCSSSLAFMIMMGYLTRCLKFEVSIFVRWLELKERTLIDWKYRESHCCARILLRPVGSSHFADAKLPSVIPIANYNQSCRSQSFSSKSYSSLSHAYLLQITKQEPSS
ncbi:hypothetical protein AB1N83_003332 [Pleurotus pulmonarius]